MKPAVIHRPLYPFLFILYVLFIPLSVNLDQLTPLQVLRPAAVLFLLAITGMLVVFYLSKDWQYAAYLVFLFLVFFFSYGHIVRSLMARFPVLYELQHSLVFLAVWTLLFVLLCTAPVWSRLKRLAWLTPFLNILFLIVLAGPVYTLMREELLPSVSSRQVVASPSSPGSDEFALDCSNPPDIYYIILDGYARQDVLAERYGVDNRPFLDYLQGKGFFVAEESHSNYVQTIFSITSSLNFDYIPPPSGLQRDISYFKGRIAHNALRALLRQCDYLFVINQSGFYFTDDLAPDAVLTTWSRLTEFEGLLLGGSPYEVIAQRLNLEQSPQSYAAHRQRIVESFAGLEEAYQLPGPKLVFAHIVSPHPPFVFNDNGDPLNPRYPYSMNDGDEFQGTVEEYLAGYAGQVEFVNRELKGVVDSLLARSETPPVIIIQGDHGPGLGMDWGSPYNTCLWERSSILNAYYLPGVDASALYPSISPVNTFRVVLNQYFGLELPLLPDDTYFTSHRMRRQAIQVNDGRNLRENCEIPGR